jgi:YD repeat-containing protein
MTTYNYDSMDRLLSKVPDPSLNQPTISFTHTLTGQRLSMTDASGTTNYPTYDNRDRLKTKATPEGTLGYTYDAHGNVLTIASSNANGASMTYTYDALNRLASATDNRLAQGGPSTPATYSYDPAGNLSAYVYPNTVQTGNIVDPLNRLAQTCVATSSPACTASQKLSSYAYTLGAAGNRTNMLELGGRNVAYGYDNDYRLTSEAITGDPAGNNGTVNYTQYDAVGNRMQMSSTLKVEDLLALIFGLTPFLWAQEPQAPPPGGSQARGEHRQQMMEIHQQEMEAMKADIQKKATPSANRSTD